MRGAARLAVLVALLGSPWLTAAEGRAQTDRPELLDVRFDGNDAFEDRALRGVIVNRRTECRLPSVFCAIGFDLKARSFLRPREVARDALRLQVYYWERGYREARVDTAVAVGPSGATLSFSVDEGRPVTVDSVEVFSFDEIPDPTLFDDLPLRRGDPLSAILLEATRDTLQSRLLNSGFAFADVLVNYEVPRDSYRSQVLFDVATGPRTRFGAITVSGAEELDTTSVRRLLPFREGQLYRASQVREGQRNLYGLELIQSARVEPLAAVGDTVIPVQVNISEGQVHRVRGGFGWSTAECLTAEARWASRNFQGGARRLTVRARLSNILAPSLERTACTQVGGGEFAELSGLLSVELFQPFLFSSRNSFSANAFLERQSVRNAFIRRAIGLDLAFSRDLGRRLFFTFGWRPALTDLAAADVFFCSSFAACLPEDIDIFEGANWLSPLALTFAQDLRNSILNPSQGWAWLLDLEHARTYTGSDFEYDRLFGEVSAYRSRGSTVFAGRIGGGVEGSGRFANVEEGQLRVVHPQKRFFSGGANSVRGFAENRLGPQVLFTGVANLLGYAESDALGPVCTPEAVVDATCDPARLADEAFLSQPVGGTVRFEANAEVRFPILAASLQGVSFVDVGQVWANRREVRLDELEVTPGLGVRYLTPIGPLRIDVAYRFGGDRVLPVATTGLREFELGDDPDDRIVVDWAGGSTRTLEWVRTTDVSFLSRGAAFGDPDGFFSHLQLHISIGQAF